MKTRAEIVKDLPTNIRVLELGVAAGSFAVDMIKVNPLIHYTGIDRWSDHHNDTEMMNAEVKIKDRSPDAIILKSTFKDALHLFTDGTFDLIYIDGYAHTGQDNGETLDDWYPKLKSGGIFSGHDYCAKYQPTIDAVDAFTYKHNLILNIIRDGDHPSWWVFKP